MTIVDVGCGHGSMCIDIAESDPSCKVIGFDINDELIDFAKWNLNVNYPSLKSRVEFHCMDLQQSSIPKVDMIVSKSSFEHILELDKVLEAIKMKLRAGGRLYTGFSPLYPSPFGAHLRIHNSLPFPWLPWGHLMVPDRYILNCVNKQKEDSAFLDITELGLNKYSVIDFHRIFTDSGLQIVSFDKNLPGKSWKAKVLNLLAQVSILEKYMTFSIYSILEKPV